MYNVPTKFVIVLGSLMSGLGKGIITSSILKTLEFYDYKTLPMKFDGYLNYDCGTMNPYRHGEVFVLDDGSEVDMDFGMYERFTNKSLNGQLSITGGKILSKVINKERKGDYLGEDVQIIPHLTNELISWVEDVGEKNNLDVLVIEVGGTVGDIENSYFIEAVRQLALRRDVVFVDLTYIPKLSVVGEQKTKPTQLAFRALMQLGIKPDFIFCRSEDKLDEKIKHKISMFTGVPKENVIDDITLGTLYEAPLHFMDQGFDKLLLGKLQFENPKPNQKAIADWKNNVDKVINSKETLNVALVGKYMHLHDSYISVKESLVHAAAALGIRVDVKWVESTDLESTDVGTKLKDIDGIIVPGGFGSRGVEGKMNAIRYARENRLPYLGLCLGMQLMAVEYARNVCKLEDANSAEFKPDAKNKIIDIMPSQLNVKQKGGTMRLGAYDCVIKDNTIAKRAYGTNEISERHRHRFELNNEYRDVLQKNGLVISGTTPKDELVEMIEWSDGFGIATQAHPELKSKFGNPAPLFLEFVKACKEKKQQ